MRVLISTLHDSIIEKDLINEVILILERYSLLVEMVSIPSITSKCQGANQCSPLNLDSIPPLTNIDLHISTVDFCKSILPLPNILIVQSNVTQCRCTHNFEHKVKIIELDDIETLEKILVKFINNSQGNKKSNFDFMKLIQNSFIIARLMLIESKVIRQILLLIWSNLQLLAIFINRKFRSRL